MRKVAGGGNLSPNNVTLHNQSQRAPRIALRSIRIVPKLDRFLLRQTLTPTLN